jgi:hypothetical protein
VAAAERSAGLVAGLSNQAVAALARAARSSRPRGAKGSPALALRRQLGGRLQRLPTTSGGEWFADKFNLLQDADADGNTYPAAAGVRGADIALRFKPNHSVDAELIGLSQSVESYVNNALNLTPAAATRAIPHADAIPVNTGPGETDEGTAIDMAQGYNSPIYAVQSTASTSLADNNTLADWGQNGSHFTDAAGHPHDTDATLKDTPIRGQAAKDSRQVFEVTALATKGAQAGTYYGSVRWGWRTDAAGAFTKIPLQVVSEGVPSSSFIKAAEIWNKGKSSTGAANVALPIVDVKVTRGTVHLQVAGPMLASAIPLPAGTRLQVLKAWHPPLLAGTVKVVDGPQTGLEGEVGYAEWSQIADERP